MERRLGPDEVTEALLDGVQVLLPGEDTSAVPARSTGCPAPAPAPA
ncbi:MULTISPECIES: hypothetical protein [unclassified Streptomyces]